MNFMGLRTVSGAIFDLDGTLFDSMNLWEDIDIEFLGKRGLEVPSDYMKTITSLSFREIAEYTIQRFNFPETPEELMDEWSGMAREHYLHTVLLKPDAAEWLRKLKAEGIRLGIATTLPKEMAFPALERNGVLDLFDAFTATDEVGRGKKHPDIWLEAARRISVSPEQCMVFEDLPAALRGASSAGMFTVGIGDPASSEQEVRASADFYAENYRFLLNLF